VVGGTLNTKSGGILIYAALNLIELSLPLDSLEVARDISVNR